MAKHLLPEVAIRNAKITDGKETMLSDGEGLYLRVRTVGKDWLFRYTDAGGKRRKFALGRYPDTSLTVARERASELRGMIDSGQDPHAAREEKEAEERAAKALAEALPQTVGELFNLWSRKVLAARKDGGREPARMFNKDVLPRLGAVPLTALRRGHITAVLDDVAERGANRVAGMLLADMRQMFRFAVTREIMQGDPSAGLEKKTWKGQSRERERVLSEAEIRLLAHRLPGAGMKDASIHSLWIMLATLCRIGEISKARWSDVGLEAATWRIPAGNSKNAKEHIIDLSGFALSHFKALHTLTGDTPWVLPAKNRTGCVCEKSLSKQIGDRQRGDIPAMSGRSPHTRALELPDGKWTAHDLRRTGATLMGGFYV